MRVFSKKEIEVRSLLKQFGVILQMIVIFISTLTNYSTNIATFIVSKDEVFKSSAYILFFERINDEEVSPKLKL